MRFARPCLDCQRLHKDYGDFCHDCRTLRNRAKENQPERLAHKRRMYGGTYQARRRAALANPTICHICKQPFQPGDIITADHLIPKEPNSPLAPAHKSCNSRRGSKPLS